MHGVAGREEVANDGGADEAAEVADGVDEADRCGCGGLAESGGGECPEGAGPGVDEEAGEAEPEDFDFEGLVGTAGEEEENAGEPHGDRGVEAAFAGAV